MLQQESDADSSAMLDEPRLNIGIYSSPEKVSKRHRSYQERNIQEPVQFCSYLCQWLSMEDSYVECCSGGNITETSHGIKL